MDAVNISALSNGSILIFAKEQDLDILSQYILEKSNEMWLHLREQEGDYPTRVYGKICLITLDTI